MNSLGSGFRGFMLMGLGALGSALFITEVVAVSTARGVSNFGWVRLSTVEGEEMGVAVERRVKEGWDE